MKDIKDKLSILDEIMGLCEKAAVSPMKKKTSVMAIVAPEESEEEDEEEEASPLMEVKDDAKEEDEEESVSDKLGDLDLEELKKLYSKLK